MMDATNVSFTMTVTGNRFTMDELQALLQAVRDCEQKVFPDKEIGIWVLVPQLTEEQCSQLLQRIKPPFKFGARYKLIGGVNAPGS